MYVDSLDSILEVFENRESSFEARVSIFEVREPSFEDRVSSFETLEEFFEDLEQRFRGNDLILENKTIAMNKTIDARLYVSVKSKLHHPPPPQGIPRAFGVFSCPGGREFD